MNILDNKNILLYKYFFKKIILKKNKYKNKDLDELIKNNVLFSSI
jgi:hypothetical protein